MNSIDKLVFEYSEEVSDILCNVNHYDVEALFYLTQHCNLACNGCYMGGSPNKSKDVLPTLDIDFYINELKKIPNFSRTVVFSGGEIFTAPIEYVERNARMVLDAGCALQIKTNGSWVQDADKRDQVLGMLRRLEPWYGSLNYEYSINDIVANVPKYLRNLAGAVRWNKVVTVPALDLAVSVDNILHPAKSADWFCDIVNTVTADSELAHKVNLKSFGFFQSADFFCDKVFRGNKMKITHLGAHSDIPMCKYRVNGARVESYFGDFVNVNAVNKISKLSNFVMCPIGPSQGRLIYCFYPDETVGLDCLYLESVGRVPYIGADGKYKSMNQINKDIHDKLVADYRAELLSVQR